MAMPMGVTEEKQKNGEWGGIFYCIVQIILGSVMVHIGRVNL